MARYVESMRARKELMISPTLLKLAYAYEQATRHRVAPKTVPALRK